jgi:hypothetical protein
VGFRLTSQVHRSTVQFSETFIVESSRDGRAQVPIEQTLLWKPVTTVPTGKRRREAKSDPQWANVTQQQRGGSPDSETAIKTYFTVLLLF